MSAEAEAQPVSVLRVDFVREMTDGSGNRTVIERGHHFIADSGAYLMDKVSNGERISEIWLPASGERVVVNHDLRFAIRGPLDEDWPHSPVTQALSARTDVSPAVFRAPRGYVERDFRSSQEQPSPPRVPPQPGRRSAWPGLR